MNRTRKATIVVAALLPVAIFALQSGCGSKEKEEEAPPVTTTPPPAPTPTAAAVVAPEEDAGASDADAADAADASDAKVATGSASGTIARCCAALQQNMNSAPLEQKGFYAGALATCNAARNNPQAQQAFAQIRAALAGAKMPAACQ